MKERRKIKSNKIEDLCNGPAKVGMSLGIVKETMNGCDLTTGKLRVFDGGIKDFKVGISKRINIDYAEEWIDMPWRFFVVGNSFVSKADPDAPSKKKK
jgi:DNA-3-methyladenine glycosylase